MSEELIQNSNTSIDQPTEQTLAMQTLDDGNMVVVANTPGEMQQARLAMVQWAQAKVRSIEAELADAETNLQTATQAGWNKAPFQRQLRRAKASLNYYEKLLFALEEGYVIVPNFPVTLLAIKTNFEGPSGNAETYGSWKPTITQEADASLPAGEGDYVDPEATARVWNIATKTNEQGKVVETKRYWAADEFREVSLPVKFMKPRVLQQTEAAMAARIFDEIGVLPARKKSDPVVIGRILGPGDKQVSFLISWFIDTRDL